MQNRLGPARRELEHHAATDPAATRTRRSASFGLAIEIAAAVGNQAGIGKTPVAAARKGVEHRLGPARRELEHRAECRAIEIATAVGNQAG